MNAHFCTALLAPLERPLCADAIIKPASACFRGTDAIALRPDSASLLTEAIGRKIHMNIMLTDFARPRLFPRDRRSTAIQDCSAEEFVAHINTQAPLKVLDGYADFCKLHVHRNWTSTRCSVVAITEANRHRLRSDYEARSKDEVPVLVRWFEGIEPAVANYLIPILYSREQLEREGSPIHADWGVVGCLYTLDPEEMPMVPITMLRNALGVAEGGSGVALNRAVYLRSVAFWQAHANWRP